VDATYGASGRTRSSNGVGIIKQLAEATDPILSLTINSLLPHRLHRLGARDRRARDPCQHRLRVSTGARACTPRTTRPTPRISTAARSSSAETSGPGALTLAHVDHRGASWPRRAGSSNGSSRGAAGAWEDILAPIYTGFTTDAMAGIVRAVLVDHPGLHGTLQVSSEPIAKYDLLGLLNGAFGAGIEIAPDATVRIDRSLDSSRFRALTGFVPPAWDEMVERMAADATPYDEWHRHVR
jgi:dTDP-4-dehydrorhamnose reductase